MLKFSYNLGSIYTGLLLPMPDQRRRSERLLLVTRCHWHHDQYLIQYLELFVHSNVNILSVPLTTNATICFKLTGTSTDTGRAAAGAVTLSQQWARVQVGCTQPLEPEYLKPAASSRSPEYIFISYFHQPLEYNFFLDIILFL